MSKPLVMGILNVTPDSFSDGGLFFDHNVAIAKGLEMIKQGANIIDVGGESSRPGADVVSEDEELRRVLPVIKYLSNFTRVSIDTVKPNVARESIDAGASLINDISASLDYVAAEKKAGYVVMHMQGTPQSMQQNPHYEDVVNQVYEFLIQGAKKASEIGIEEVWIDPGIGFGKTDQHNLTLLNQLSKLVQSPYPVLIGTSRKGFLGRIAPLQNGQPAPVNQRLEASLATATWAMAQGCQMVRVHDVEPTCQAAELVGENFGEK